MFANDEKVENKLFVNIFMKIRVILLMIFGSPNFTLDKKTIL